MCHRPCFLSVAIVVISGTVTYAEDIPTVGEPMQLRTEHLKTLATPTWNV